MKDATSPKARLAGMKVMGMYIQVAIWLVFNRVRNGLVFEMAANAGALHKEQDIHGALRKWAKIDAT